MGHECNARGYLWRLTDNADQSSLVTYAKANARGQATEEAYGNGTRTRRSYDARSGRLTGIGPALGAATAGVAPLDPARGFTGHEQLDRLGLVHMGGRVHDPRLGRFLSPDPVVGNPGSSQSWHAYS